MNGKVVGGIIVIGLLLGGWYFFAPEGLPSHKDFQNQENSFTEHLKDLSAALLENGPAQGFLVGLVEDGKVVYLKGFGKADEAGRPVNPDTVFNVGSISKMLTAWGVLALVEEGKVDLDSPIETYLPEMVKNGKSISVRQLLSHTAGLSMSAVPEYGPGEDMPPLREAIKDIEVIADPGTGWAYSGGGYMILQTLVEEVSATPFADYMQTKILNPLGMTSSSFRWTPALLEKAAKGHDGDHEVPNFSYVGEAAASLNSSGWDMAQFLTQQTGGGVLTPETLSLMQSPAQNAVQRFGQKYGLGYDIWGLKGGRPLVGHNGQNTGWGAAAWFAPDLQDGIVILTNHSDGYDTFKWVLCDWVKWKADTTWYGMCTNRPEFLPEPPLFSGDQELATAVDALFQETIKENTPGAAVLVSRNDTVIHQKTYGLADLETGRPATPETDFYLASLSKQFTAAAILNLVNEGQLGLDDPISSFFPDFNEAAQKITIRELLAHTSGLADYHQFYRWQPGFRLNNQGVLKFLMENPDLDFTPGEKFQYSNSGYVLLALIIEKVTGMPLEAVLRDQIFSPLGMDLTGVYDVLGEPLPSRAYGYRDTEDGFQPFDYFTLRYSDGTTAPTGYTTTGGGGLFSNIEDLYKWTGSLDFSSPVFSPEAETNDDQGMPGTTHAGFGWLLGTFKGQKMIWHDGGMIGFSNVILILPEEKMTVIILSNRSGFDVRSLALKIGEMALTH